MTNSVVFNITTVNGDQWVTFNSSTGCLILHIYVYFW